MKHYLTVLSLVALAASALFYKQILGVFAGMTALESLEVIVNFVLHVAVTTVIAYLVSAVPGLIIPYLRIIKKKQRQARRARVVNIQTAAPKPPRLTVRELLGVLAPEGKKIQRAPTPPPPEDRPDLFF